MNVKTEEGWMTGLMGWVTDTDVRKLHNKKSARKQMLKINI